MSETWQQRDDETPTSFEAFAYYRDMGPARSLAKMVKRHFGGSAAKLRWVETWSSKYDWADRARAFDAYVDERALEKVIASKVRRKVERIEMLDKVQEQLEELIPSLAKRAKADEVPLKDVISAIDKLMRNYREEFDDKATEKHEHTVDAATAGELAELLGVNWHGGD